MKHLKPYKKFKESLVIDLQFQDIDLKESFSLTFQSTTHPLQEIYEVLYLNPVQHVIEKTKLFHLKNRF